MRLAGTEMPSSLPSFPSIGQSAPICDIRACPPARRDVALRVGGSSNGKAGSLRFNAVKARVRPRRFTRFNNFLARRSPWLAGALCVGGSAKAATINRFNVAESFFLKRSRFFSFVEGDEHKGRKNYEKSKLTCESTNSFSERADRCSYHESARRSGCDNHRH